MAEPQPTDPVASGKRRCSCETLEAEMTDAFGAAEGERSEAPRGYRSGSYPRTLASRYDELARNFLAPLEIAAAILWRT